MESIRSNLGFCVKQEVADALIMDNAPSGHRKIMNINISSYDL